MADRFCVDAEEQFGLIVERGAGLLGFQHRMLQEFFAALEITSWSIDVFEAVEDRLFDPQWREVVIFVACLEAKTSAQRGRQFMKRLLTSGERTGAPAERGRQALFLSADCLAEIERSIPEIGVDVIGGLVELVCGWSDAMPASETAEAMGRLRTLALLFPEATDLVLTRAFLGAPVPVRRAVCEIVVALGIKAPGLQTELELRHGRPGVCLAERTALIGLGGEESRDPSVSVASGVPEWTIPIRQHLASFGKSEALRALDEISNDLTADGSEAEDRFAESLTALIKTAVGADAILAATALTVAHPEALLSAYITLGERGLFVEAIELLIWSAQNMRLPSDALERWSELEHEYRVYVLGLLAREPSRAGAQVVAWAEVERSAVARSEDPAVLKSPSLLLAMQILSASRQASLGAIQFRWLDELATRDKDIESAVAFVLSGATLDPDVRLDEVEPRSPPGRSLIAMIAAKCRALSGDVLKTVIAASDHPSGVWTKRAADALSPSLRYSDLGADVLHELGELLGSATSLRTQSNVLSFAHRIVMDMADEAPALLTGEIPSALFNLATPEVDALLIRWAASDQPSRSQAVESLCKRRNNGDAKIFPLVDLDSREMQWLLASNSEDDAILAGSLLARAALESASTRAAVLGIVGAGHCGAATALEFAHWTSHHGTLAPQQLEGVATQALEHWPGVPGIAVAARLLVPTDDNGQAFFASVAVSRAVLLDALLLAGDHPAMWALGLDSPPMRLLSNLIERLCKDRDFFESTVAAYADALRTGCDWPRARFALHQLMELGTRAPDALNTLASKYDLVSAVTPYLASKESFGVRARAFVVLARIGHLDENMFDALLSSARDVTDVSTRVFESLRFIRSVDDAVVKRMRPSLESGGVEAVASLDATIQLLHSYALDESTSLRRSLLDSLLIATSAASPWTVCRLPSGLGLALWPAMTNALFRLLTNTDDLGQVRPIMLMRPAPAFKPPGAVDPKRSFTENLLIRVREQLHAAMPSHDKS